MKDYHKVIKAPIVTEKTTQITADGNKVAFWVDLKATKTEVKTAIEKLFNVKVLDVNTQRVPGKKKRMGRFVGKKPTRKKAYVSLKEGDTIEIFSGV